ncbi:hypothetical protein [Pseudarthrobacter oxydans]
MADVSHPDHDEFSAWVTDMTGSTELFDPAFLDIADMNRTLAKLF